MTSGTRGYGTLLQRGTTVPSHMHTGVIGNNNGLLWTAVTEGTTGDLINVHIVDPGAPAGLTVVVVGVAIHVNLAYAAGNITSTANDVRAAIEASNAASALVICTNDGASTGAGLMVAEAETFLASGSDVETYTTVAEVGSIAGVNMTLGTTEATHQTSTGGVREFIPTLFDSGELSFPISFLPTNATQDQIYGLVKDIKHKILRHFQMVMTDSTTTTASFSAYVTALSNAAPIDGKLTANISLKISGQVSFA